MNYEIYICIAIIELAVEDSFMARICMYPGPICQKMSYSCLARVIRHL